MLYCRGLNFARSRRGGWGSGGACGGGSRWGSGSGAGGGGDGDLVCAVDDAAEGEAISAAFVGLPEVVRVLGQGATKASVLTGSGLQVDLRIIPKEHFGAALMYFTGSKEHNVKLRSRALDMGMTLNEWGLYKITIDKKADKGKSGGR